MSSVILLGGSTGMVSIVRVGHTDTDSCVWILTFIKRSDRKIRRKKKRKANRSSPNTQHLLGKHLHSEGVMLYERVS